MTWVRAAGVRAVVLGLAKGCVSLRGLGGSFRPAHGPRSLLSQGEQWAPAGPSQPGAASLSSTPDLQTRSVPAPCHTTGRVAWPLATPLLPPDMKESKKDALQPPAPELGPKPEANGEPLPEAAVPEKPEVELSNLVTCSKLAQSQASLHSASSVGSVRGDEGGAYSEFFGDYAPLFDNRQDPDNISLQGSCRRWGPAAGPRGAAGWDTGGARGRVCWRRVCACWGKTPQQL